MELEIINKKPIQKLYATTDGAKVYTAKSNMLIRNTPISKRRDPVVFRIVCIFKILDLLYGLVFLINEIVSSRSKQG